MKKFIFGFTAIAMSALMLTSCSKDQKVVNQIEGTWKASKVELGATDITTSAGLADDRWTFVNCKVKDAFCGGTHLQSATLTTPFTYSIQDKGATLIMIEGVDTTTSTILEHSKTSFIFLTDSIPNVGKLKLSLVPQ